MQVRRSATELWNLVGEGRVRVQFIIVVWRELWNYLYYDNANLYELQVENAGQSDLRTRKLKVYLCGWHNTAGRKTQSERNVVHHRHCYYRRCRYVQLLLPFLYVLCASPLPLTLLSFGLSLCFCLLQYESLSFLFSFEPFIGFPCPHTNTTHSFNKFNHVAFQCLEYCFCKRDFSAHTY